MKGNNLHKIFAAATLAVCLSVTGCNEKDILEPTPVTLLADVEAFKSADRINALLRGLYTSVKNGQLYGSRYLIYQDVRGEDFTNTSGNFVTAAYAYQHAQISSNAEVNNLWSAGYLAINRINIFLQGLEENSGVLTGDVANNFKGEARLLRALTYYSLVNIYAKPYTLDNGASPGLPLRLQAEIGPGNNDMARSKVAEVYAEIIKDLDFAEQNLPLTYATAENRTIRAHRNTAIALKTRVYASMGNMAKVKEEAQKIVSGTTSFSAASGVPHALAANVATVFAPPYTSVESIFSFPMPAPEFPGLQNALGSYYNPAIIGDYAVSEAANSIFASPAFAANDKRRTDLLTKVGTYTRLKKFWASPTPTDHVPVIRYAEVLLTYAEAIVKTEGVTPLALDLLNAVRGRSTTPYLITDLATPEAFLNALYLERRIEFLGEGLRAIDIMRLNQPFPAKSSPTLGAVGEIGPSNTNYIWPLPQNELNTNKKINQ